MTFKENELREMVYNLGITLSGGFDINILKSIIHENLTIDDMNKIKTGYQCTKNNKIQH